MALQSLQTHETQAMTTGTQTTLQVPTGGRIQSIMLQFLTSAGVPVTEAQLRAEVGNIRLTINGIDVINTTAARLYDLYEFTGSRLGVPAGINGVIELNVGALLQIDPLQRAVLGFGTQNVTSIQVQVTAGTLTNVASVRASSARTAVKEVLGAHCSFIDYPQNFNSTGPHTVDTLPRNINEAYLGLLVDDGASGAISTGEVRIGNTSVYEPTLLNCNAVHTSNQGYNQIAGHYTYLFTDGSVQNNLPMQGVSDFRVITTFGTAPGAGGYNVAALRLVNIPLTPASNPRN